MDFFFYVMLTVFMILLVDSISSNPMSGNISNTVYALQIACGESGWQDMEIEAKWSTDKMTFDNIVKAFPSGGEKYGYNLEVRWDGNPKKYVDNYYDKDNTLFDNLHMLRDRTRYSVPQNDILPPDSSLSELQSAPWTPDWQKVQYKSDPSRLSSVWFRAENGALKLSSVQVTQTLSGNPPHTSQDNPIALLQSDHPNFVFPLTENDIVLDVTQFRYRVLLHDNTGEPVYELSLDRITSSDSPTESFGVELEALHDNQPHNANNITELFSIAEQLQNEFNLIPSTTSKGGIIVQESNCGPVIFEFDRERYPSNDIAIITQVGSNKFLDPDSVDLIDVNVWSDSDAGGIDIFLVETGDNTRIFTGEIILTTTDESSGHRLRVAEGGAIIAEAADGASDTARIGDSLSLPIIRFDKDSYFTSETPSITLEYGNIDDDLIDTILVNVISSSDSDGTSISLIETGTDTGIFVGSLDLTTDESVSNALLVSDGDIMTVTFENVLDTAHIVSSANSNLFVSAENSQFDNYMSGPQVIEVVVIDSDINDTDEAKGEPDVTINGKIMRMVQAVDGNWYGYFADTTMAETADAITTVAGEGLDFGDVCTAAEGTAFTGLDLGDIDDVALDTTGDCTTDASPAITDDPAALNVLREAKDANMSVPSQITNPVGLTPTTWPFIQLYDLNPTGNVVVQYHKGGGVQTTTLTFDTVDQFVNLELDRIKYSHNTEVYLTITDVQLNIDPTDEDSWTFGTNPDNKTMVYQVFTENGDAAADGTLGAVDIRPLRDDLMFGDNADFSINADVQQSGTLVVRLDDNDYQQIINFDGPGFDATTAVTEGGSFTARSQPVTLTETRSSSGVFVNYDKNNDANIVITNNAILGSSASIIYNTDVIHTIEVKKTSFAVIGDYGDATSEEEEVSNLVKRWNPDFIITVGDNNYPDGEASTIDNNVGQYYHEFIGNYRGNFGEGSISNRFFPTLGNHDWDNPPSIGGDISPYLEYFTLPGNERYYNFVKDPVHFFAYDSDRREPDGIDINSIQAIWLQTGLSNSDSRWNIVFFHHSPYSSGSHGSDLNLIPLQEIPFGEWGADVVLGGHDHHYERLLINDGSGPTPYFVNGIGGADIRSVPIPIREGSEFTYDDQPGAMLIEADNDCLSFKFINTANVEIDSYSIGSCPLSKSHQIFQCVANHKLCKVFDLGLLIKVKIDKPVPLCDVIDCDPICLSCPRVIITKDTVIDIQREFPPLKQYNVGISAKEIIPSHGNVLVIANDRDIPSSVTMQTAEKLVNERGWKYFNLFKK